MEQPETFWAYLAAFIDGEGSITMCQNGPRLIITNSHLETLEWIRDSLEMGYLAQLKGGYGQTKPCYSLSFGSHACEAILPKIIQYMRIKKRKGELLLGYLNKIRQGSYHESFVNLRQEVKQEMANA